MQGCDDFQPFFGLIASTVARSRLRQEQNSRDIQSRTDQSSSEEEAEDDRESEEDDRESSPNSNSSASHDSRSKESERSEMSCEWMFEGFWYFRNKYGLLPNEEIEEDKFDEIWGELGNEFKSKFLAMMPVTPYYIVVVSCPDHITADELELELPIRGYVAAKRTSRDSWRGCRQRADFVWTKVTDSLAGFGAVTAVCIFRGQGKSE